MIETKEDRLQLSITTLFVRKNVKIYIVVTLTIKSNNFITRVVIKVNFVNITLKIFKIVSMVSSVLLLTALKKSQFNSFIWKKWITIFISISIRQFGVLILTGKIYII